MKAIVMITFNIWYYTKYFEFIYFMFDLFIPHTLLRN